MMAMCQGPQGYLAEATLMLYSMYVHYVQGLESVRHDCRVSSVCIGLGRAIL